MRKSNKKSYLILKRVLDILFSLILIVVLFPVFIFVSIFIKITSNGPILFKQKRVGKNNRDFIIYKFRTMDINAPKYMATCDIDSYKYISSFSRFLRKTSLDELPQIFNVFLGNMSFIGPRPLIPQEELIHKMRFERGIYNILPGITGLAQINGRDEVPIQQKVEYDYQYFKSMSFTYDLFILLKTFIKVLKHESVVDGKKKEEINENMDSHIKIEPKHVS